MTSNNHLFKKVMEIISRPNIKKERWRLFFFDEEYDKQMNDSDDCPIQKYTSHYTSAYSTTGYVFLTTIIILILLTTTALITLGFGAHQWQLTPGLWQPLTSSTTTPTDLVRPAPSSTSSSLPTAISCPAHPSIEQREQGSCIFDPVLLQWLPKPCVHVPVLESTLNSTSFLAQPPYEIAGDFIQQIYSDPELRYPISPEEVSQIRQYPYYVTLRFHRAHCAYMFRMIGEVLGEKARQAREKVTLLPTSEFGNKDLKDKAARIQTEYDSGLSGVYIWREAVTQTHTDHCAAVLASRGGNLDDPEKFYAGGGTCVLL